MRVGRDSLHTRKFSLDQATRKLESFQIPPKIRLVAG